MRIPVDTKLQHIAPGYDPAKAHAYYLKVRQLKGRQKGSADPQASFRPVVPSSPKEKQKKALQDSIQNLQKKLGELEALIKKREHEEASDNRKAKAKKERSAKAKDKPKTAAEKASIARQNKKYADKHKQELKNKSKQASSKSSGGGSSSKSASTPAKASVSDLKQLATKVKGQIAVAKQKLSAL